MIIETLIYNQLQTVAGTLVGQTGGFSSGFSSGFADYVPGRIYPTMSDENTEIPFIVFMVQSRTNDLSLTAPNLLTKYGFIVDSLSLNFDQAATIAETIIDNLHGWSNPSLGVQLCALQTETSEVQELGYHSSITFNLYYKAAS